MVYIASPLRGDYEKNIEKAVEYCKMVAEQGIIPLAPHIIFSQWCNDSIPSEREKGLELGLELMKHCSELWVMGEEISEGMRGELLFARENDIPTYHIKNPKNTLSYPISIDGNTLLGSFDAVHNSSLNNYENQVVILNQQELREEFKTPLNQLWIATHGPGCRPDFLRSDTVHLTHPIDGDRLVVGRSSIIGIAKDEVVENVYNKYEHILDEENFEEIGI
ncbi:MAG: DUF4406 domain-containing protein [Clostridia bacterium]